MADDRTPTTEEVRDCYATGGPMPGERLIQRFADEYAEFDRWLAAHDAEVEARVRGEVAEVTNEMVEAAREPHVGDPASMWEVSEDDERCNESSAILFCARPVGHDGLHAARWDAKVQGVWR